MSRSSWLILANLLGEPLCAAVAACCAPHGWRLTVFFALAAALGFRK